MISHFTCNLVVASSFCLCPIALFHTVHRNTAPSSSLAGTIEIVAVVLSIFDPSCKTVEFIRSEDPSLNQEISGGGEPPELEHVMFMGLSSVAMGVRGVMVGGEGLMRTVMPILLVWSNFPVPASLSIHLNSALSRW